MINDIDVEEGYFISSDNIFADDGRPNPEERMMRAELLCYPHSAEGLTEKRISRKVAKNRGGVRKCHKKWSIKRKDWIIWE